MKIRTVEALDELINRETSWRKHELTTALKLIKSSSGHVQIANIRAGVLLLYAHWEGWVKAVARLYIQYVNTKAISYNHLSEAFLGTALKTKMTEVDAATRPLKHNQFASFIRADLSKRAPLSEQLIQTKGNLSSTVFVDILTRLGLDLRPEFTLRANLIDEELVERRNSIAHGNYLDLNADDYIKLRSKVMELLELFTDDVRNAASTGSYLAIPKPQV